MSYKDKIQLLEQRIKELDNDLKITEAVVEENINALRDISINGWPNLEEASRLYNEAKESKNPEETQTALDKSTQELEKAKKLLESMYILMKRGLINDIEKYHKHNSIIRNISLEAAKDIDEKIRNFETIVRGLWSFFDVTKLENNSVEMENKFKEAINAEKELICIISLARNCIKSTMDKFKD